MQNMYERIAFYSKQAGYKNVTELSKAAGVARAIFTELKSGRTTTSTAATGLKIAKACNISVEELFGEKEKPADEGELDKKATIINAVDKMDGDEVWEILDELRARPEMRMLFHSAKGATADQLRAIAQMIDGFKG
ncbi:MAG: helix-turn-helix transcriptional regulator [Clostridia bacterium]|nr:helix-turn-helix transcriptional regulator [Clostridia bacterium]